MLITATVTPPFPLGSLPPSLTPEVAHQLAEALTAEGVDVVLVTEFGVVVRASKQTFERSLGVQPGDARPFSAVARPSSQRLRQLAGRVEVSAAAVPLL